MIKKVFIILLILFVIAQFFRTNKTNPEYDLNKDFLEVEKAPQEVKEIFNTSCYDCHSHHTNYAWYSNIAPISWLVSYHIKEARSYANFSTWQDYSQEAKRYILKNTKEEIRNDEMPFKPYLITHKESALNNQQKKLLIEWLETIQP